MEFEITYMDPEFKKWINGVYHLNFNALDILPSLLNKTKTQSLRRAWKEIFPGLMHDNPTESDMCAYCGETIYNDDYHDHPDVIVPRPAKFKVGDIINLIWKKDSESEWFCKRHGKGIITNHSDIDPVFSINKIEAKNFRFGKDCNCTPSSIYLQMDRERFDSLFFNKNLGTVEITKIFKIKIDWPKKDISMIKVIRNNKKLTMGEVEDLAQRDGFTGEDNGSDLLNCLNKIYDLMGQCREFHTSRWRWL